MTDEEFERLCDAPTITKYHGRYRWIADEARRARARETALLADNKRLTQERDRAIEKLAPTCAACNWVGTPQTTWDELRAHVESCEKHPLTSALRDNQRLTEVLAEAHEQACRFGCASKWRTADGEESRHTDTCRKARAALSGAKPGDGG